jgi:hypothetical protein
MVIAVRSNNDCPDDKGNHGELRKERYSRRQVDAPKPEICKHHHCVGIKGVKPVA